MTENQKASVVEFISGEEENRNNLVEAFAKFQKEGFSNSSDAFKILMQLGASSSDKVLHSVRNLAEQAILKAIHESHTEEVLRIVEIFKLNNDILRKPEISEAFREEIKYQMESECGATSCVVLDGIEYFMETDELQDIVKKAFIISLENGGDMVTAFKIRDKFFPNEEIVSVCQKGLEACLLKKNIDSALNINSRFLHLSSEKAFELYAHHLPLKELKENLPNVVEQAKKSLELFFSLFFYRQNPEDLIKVVKENPFLSDALQENPRFGPKLILKYHQFDDVSKTKVRFLFETKKKILKNHPDLDPKSLEFRQAMQAELFVFDHNQEMNGELEKTEIDTDQWLNYEETSYFTLKSGEELVPFSEIVRTPLDRLGQTIGSYAHQVKSVLAEWRDDLSKLEIESASVEEDRAKLRQMETEQAKAKESGDEKKAQGITRGMEGLQQKIERTKKLPVWNRLADEIAGFTKLKSSLDDSHSNLISTENKYEELASFKMPSGVELSKLKSQLSQAKEDFRKRFSQLGRRLESFRTNFPNLIIGLGKDRASALEQELNERMAEQFNHYDFDCQTLESLFSEKKDKEKEKLEDRPMSIFVWARNPDKDLYQGNYSPCCICIESAHTGAKSAIADYATDLGIQIVNVWDEEKNEPVVAAWCWLGQDEQGKTALVVDNIEANTLFSSNFPTELWQELRAYLQNYAKSIGADRLVMGKANNDLPVAGELVKLAEAEAKYTKIGGQNSRPDGYFLEAEDASVKLLWEKGRKKVKKTKEREKRPKVELKDVFVRELTPADFAAIIQLETQVYEGDVVRGEEMISDLKQGHGLKYSVASYGKWPQQKREELLGYIVAYEDKTDEGHPSVYLDDIAVAGDLQGHGLGWRLLEKTIERLKGEAQKRGQPILFDMHLKETSQGLFEKHKEDLEKMGVTIVESVLVPDYYDEGEDALYCVYEVRG
ncbi:MAG: GNAT family N-acetyltransferase [Candidatus Magasanikbacteria bacterium]|nr:GNAT family N-acetyltransferase [Candidatus Magasanikbacteria bacterium]